MFIGQKTCTWKLVIISSSRVLVTGVLLKALQMVLIVNGNIFEKITKRIIFQTIFMPQSIFSPPK